jgi:hypothetical protein
MISTHQNKLSFRSFKEKQNGLSILALLVTYGYYITSIMRSADPINSQHIGTLITMTIIYVLIHLTAQLLMPRLFPNEAQAVASGFESEAELQAYKVTYFVLLAGVFTSLTLSLVNMPSFWVVQNLLFFFMISELGKNLIELVLLRRV